MNSTSALYQSILSGLTIQGTVNATAGSIGGCTIQNGTLKIANANIDNINASKITAGLGAWLGYFLGGSDGLLYALLVFIVVDYLTGVMCAVSDHCLNSAVGFRGLCRKGLTLMLVGIAHVLDVHILGQPGVIRTAVVFWAIANNGLSILENSAHLGLPVPDQLKQVLEQLHNRAEKSGEPETIVGEDIDDS